MDLIQTVISNAKKYNKHIVLPEGLEERTLKAADIVLGEQIARITLIGRPDAIWQKAAELGLKHIDKATLVDPEQHDKKEAYIDLMLQIRQSKGLTREQAD